MRVTVLELPARWGSPERALAQVDALVTKAPSDLVLLPEASLTGYVSPSGDADLRPFAETLDGPSARAIADLAVRHRTAIVAPLILREETRLYNAMIGFDRDGRHLFTYRKRHPWYPETWATPGEQPSPIVRIGHLDVTLLVCFDVQFVEAEPQTIATLRAADLLLFPSAWVEREDSRATMLAELARAHHVAIANANWGAGVVRIAGQGRSAIYDRAGAVVARAESGLARATLVAER